MNKRPEIPSKMKRLIRQRCGFGCVICGFPIYEYDHMTEWSVVEQHIETDITLLCDRHHKEKTLGLLPLEKVRMANANPFNILNGSSSPFTLHYSGNEIECNISSFKITHNVNKNNGAFIPFIVDNKAIIYYRIEDFSVLLNLKFFDDQDIPILLIADNELVLKPDAWDIEFVGRTITIKRKLWDILLEITFEPPTRVSIKRAKITTKNSDIEITTEKIQDKINGNTYQVGKAHHCLIGIYMKDNTFILGSGFIEGIQLLPGDILMKV